MSFDPSTLEFGVGVITEIVSIVSAIIFAALFLERRTNSKIQNIKQELCNNIEELEKRLKEFIDSKQEISKERAKHINDTIEKLEKQIERLENMSFTEYYKRFYPRHRSNGDDVLPSK